MRPATPSFLTLILTVLSIGAVGVSTGCAQKKKVDDGSADSSASISESDLNSDMADSDTGKAMGLQTVHYAYDSATLDSSAKAVLKSNAQILKDKSSVRVQIEGHTDERGGIQYNIALAERRANAAKAYLVDRGVNSDRVSVISYGKEKPVDSGHNESAWAQNRRANFRITEK